MDGSRPTTRGTVRAKQTIRMLADAPMRTTSVANVLGKSFKGPSPAEIKTMFDMIDINKDGVIERWELISAMQIINEGEEQSSAMIKRSIFKFIELADQDDDGQIDFDEFTTIVKDIVDRKAEPLKPPPPPPEEPKKKKKKVQKRKSPAKAAAPAKRARATSSTAATPAATTSSFGGGFSFGGARTPPKAMDAKTEIDLKGYKYGEEPAAGTTSGELDVVFMLDCTGSMGSTIQSCKDNTAQLINKLRSEENQDVRFSLVPYRDHQENRGNEYCTKVYPFTRDTEQIKKSVNEQRATGGCDGPEAVTAALYECLCVDWRPDATKLVVLMADAGPHGLERGGYDDYPEGDPDGKDPVVIAKEMESLGITVYSLMVGGCRELTKWFFSAVSQKTGGLALALSDASLLADAIAAGARESLVLERSVTAARSRIAELEGSRGGAGLSTDERAKAVEESLAAADTESLSVTVPRDKVINVPEDRLGQANEARTLADLALVWSRPVGASAPRPTAGGSDETTATRVARIAEARDARSTDKVVVECIKEGSKVRARVVSDGYDNSKNVQFPRDIREAGKKFLVDMVVDAGKFYRVKGDIKPHAE